MTKKQLSYAFNKVIEAAQQLKCRDMHHSKADQHMDDEVCPVEYRLQKHIHMLHKHMKKQGL
jgi:hypothetical protein